MESTKRRLESQSKMKEIEMNNLTWFAPQKMNNVEYCAVVLKDYIYDLEWKSWIKTNYYSDFLLDNVKYLLKKIVKMALKWPKMANIRH